MILDVTIPILYFQFLRVISYVIFPFVVWSPLWSYWRRFSPIHFYHSLVTRCKCRNMLDRCTFLWFILFSRLINSFNSSFVL